jgi:hypothetical protein
MCHPVLQSPTMDRERVDAWLESYRRAWEQADTPAATASAATGPRPPPTKRTSGSTSATLIGTAVLRFDPDGLVAESREYWFLEPGTHPRHAGWGD